MWEISSLLLGSCNVQVQLDQEIFGNQGRKYRILNRVAGLSGSGCIHVDQAITHVLTVTTDTLGQLCTLALPENIRLTFVKDTTLLGKITSCTQQPSTPHILRIIGGEELCPFCQDPVRLCHMIFALGQGSPTLYLRSQYLIQTLNQSPRCKLCLKLCHASRFSLKP